MDVVIISASSLKIGQFWRERIQNFRHALFKKEALLFVVEEDWPGGAGTGFGTLYVYEKARKEAREKYGIDLLERQRQGGSVAIYHTGGRGTRLAPLTLAEGLNKSAVRLPGWIDDQELITVLEAVIEQSSIYAKAHAGRLLVFWGDQLFIPEQPPQYSPTSHIEIFAKSISRPDRQMWNSLALDHYGIIAEDLQGRTIHLNKLSYPLFSSLIEEGEVAKEGSFALSLGSFSLSIEMLEALLSLFKEELQLKQNTLDSDFDLWMPLTVRPTCYKQLIIENSLFNKEHFNKIVSFRDAFLKKFPAPLFGLIDIGRDSFWWDFGSVGNYFTNLLKICGQDREGKALRAFFKPKPDQKSDLIVNDNSYISHSSIKSGIIRNSIVMGTTAEHLEVENCIIINSHILSLKTARSLIYRIEADQPLILPPETVRVDAPLSQVFQKGAPHKERKIPFYSTLSRNGKEDWQIILPHNFLSYADWALYTHSV